ncbi:MAG: hypothetical protein JXR46_11590 [Calditrichaceae bacterium]|nr:hypothetical protein [Calditrichaceae bacterium]MBN2709678.1 hypothetical protein [Calditrichaceae bacterium]RQV95036.1 MAG: hypothetical protein EH224_08630 [Calditrichota bacterium]
MTNKNYIIYISAIILIIFSANSSKAQAIKSVYSLFGIGELTDNDYGINKSLGGTGIAFQSGRSVNYLNPASYLGIAENSINIELGIYGLYNTAKTTSAIQTDADLNLSYFSSAFYLADWWALCLGVTPYSSVDYKIISSDQIVGEFTSYEKIYMGSGGLNRIFLGNSFKIYKGLSFGFNASVFFGKFSQTETAVSSGSFDGYALTNQRVASTFYLDYGLQYRIIYNDFSYTIGLIYGGGKTLNTSNEADFEYESTTVAIDLDKQPFLKIPRKFGVGIALTNGQKFRAGIDYEWRNWADINFSDQNIDTRNSQRYSIGFEYSPGQRKNWFKKLFYRIGANYKNSYLKIKNIPIDSKSIITGIGIPYGQTSIFNIAFEYGEEGVMKKGLIKNSYGEIYLSFSLHEILALKPQED